jgi:ribosomal protein S18 acetylase RimI-like enzyme
MYYSELQQITTDILLLPQEYLVDSWNREDTSERNIFEVFYKYQDENIVKEKIISRFKRGAELWTIQVSKQIAGFVWSIRGTTIKPYFFPLGPNDVHLFDNEIFPPFRGKGLNSILIDSVLLELKKKGILRAFIETRNWNIAEINSLSKTKLKIFGQVVTLNIGKKVIIWLD